MTTLTIENVTYSAGTLQILRSISFSLKHGEWVAVVGPNGAGKSTLLRVMCGLLPLSSGKVALENVDLRDMQRSQIAARISLVPQRIGNLPGFTVDEFLSLSRGMRQSQIENSPGVALTRSIAGKNLPELSGGELQRALIAGAIEQGSQFLFLDEPTANLDPQGLSEFEDILEKLKERSDVSCAFVTHDLSLSVRRASKIIVMKEGRILWSGSQDDKELLGALQEGYETSFLRIPHPTRGYDLVLPG